METELMIGINYWAVLVCAVVSMVVGFVWYGPLFGKAWQHVCNMDDLDLEARKAMQQQAGKLYLLQFLLSLVQIYILAHFIIAWQEAAPIETALWIWLGFIMPIVAQGAMWNNDSAKISWTRFGIQASFQLVLIIIYALILGNWQ